jgi:hypothetical protein
MVLERPERTFLKMLPPSGIPATALRCGIRWPAVRKRSGASEEPRFKVRLRPTRHWKDVHTIVPSLEFAERYDIAKFGDIPKSGGLRLPRMPTHPGTRALTHDQPQYVPYHLRTGTWDDNQLLGRPRSTQDR